MKQRELKVGNVVQIDPEHSPTFGACFMIVTEPKAWGAQGYVMVLPSIDENGMHVLGGRAYYRCKFEHMEFVGPATWIEGDEAYERTSRL